MKFNQALYNDFLQYAKEKGMRIEDDQEIVFSEQEKRLMNSTEKFLRNSLGFEVEITTLTSIARRISEQKFFHVAPADYMPVVVGEGAWSSNITKFRSFEVADSFSTGVLNSAGQNSRLASADAAVDSLNILVYNWGKEVTWTIMEMAQASRSGNFDLVSSKEKARKTNWDLGIQELAFLGLDGNNGVNGSCLGLLNQPGIAPNTAIITKPIKSMTPTELKTLQENLINSYRARTNRTAFPTHFIIPESDFLGLASQASPEFPMISVLKLLEDALKLTTGNAGFKILPLSYADATYHAQVPLIAGKQVYTLLNYDEDSLVMNIPVDFTTTLTNSLNNFQLQNVGYGQFSGVLPVRPLELMYFTYAA